MLIIFVLDRVKLGILILRIVKNNLNFLLNQLTESNNIMSVSSRVHVSRASCSRAICMDVLLFTSLLVLLCLSLFTAIHAANVTNQGRPNILGMSQK